jgi:hypothetical protein
MKKKKPAVARALAKLKGEALKAKARKAARAEELLALIERKKLEILDAFYDIGLALKELAGLYGSLDYDSLKDCLEDRASVSYSTAKELLAIVDVTPRAIALQLGKEKSFELVKWTRSTPAVDTPASVYRANEEIDGVPVRDASAQHISRARKKLEASKAPKDAKHQAAERAARALQGWLRKNGAKSAKAVARRGQGGWVLAVELPVAEAEKLIG